MDAKEIQALDALIVTVQDFLSSTGQTQRELADRAGIYYTFLNRMLKGKASPTIPVAERLAKAMGMQLDEALRAGRKKLPIPA